MVDGQSGNERSPDGDDSLETLVGEDGNDTLIYGNAGYDTLILGGGNDRNDTSCLRRGTGSDYLDGGRWRL